MLRGVGGGRLPLGKVGADSGGWWQAVEGEDGEKKEKGHSKYNRDATPLEEAPETDGCVHLVS